MRAQSYSKGRAPRLPASPKPTAQLGAAPLQPRRVHPLPPAPCALQQLRDVSSPLLGGELRQRVLPRRLRRWRQRHLPHKFASHIAGPECSPAQVAARMRLGSRCAAAAAAAIAACAPPAPSDATDSDAEMADSEQP